MQKLLDFEITDARIEKLVDDTTVLCEFRVISDGDNKHEKPLTIDVIKDAAERTLRGKPILASYSNWERDLQGHRKPEESEPIGYFIESQDFVYKPVEDGKTALFAKGLLWKRYAPRQVGSIFDGENHSKSVSMEIAINSLVDDSDESLGIASFDFLGLAILGESYPPASVNAKATLLTFSEMKNRYEAMFAVASMKINNSKENAVKSSGWVNPGRRLYQPLLSKSNKLALLKEAYLVVDENKIDTAPSEDRKSVV